MKKPRKSARIAKLEAEVAELTSSIEENRRLNERLSDVLDVITELLVPAAERDDPRVEQALEKLEKSKKRVTRKR
jgi:hypothetical protein